MPFSWPSQTKYYWILKDQVSILLDYFINSLNTFILNYHYVVYVVNINCKNVELL